MIKIFVAIIGIMALVIILLSFFTGSSDSNADENGLINAAKSYYSDNKGLLPKTNYDTVTVSLNTLISGNYIKPSKNDNGTIRSCGSYVVVEKIGADYIYNPYILCNNTNDTKLLYDKVISNVSTQNDGLYKINDEYVYKGENPDNYVTFANQTWRIIKVDKDKIIHIIYAGDDEQSSIWDNRFNVTDNANTGINEFSVSRIYAKLQDYLNDSKNFTSDDRSKLAFVNLCIGKRSSTDNTADGSTECSKTLDKQMIGLLQANEYINASNDTNCSATSSRVCQNYNFLAETSYWTLTASSDATSEVYEVYPYEGLNAESANNGETILPVLYLKSDTVIRSGNGTSTDPFVIR